MTTKGNELFPKPPVVTYVVRGNHYWGRGATIAEAFAQLKKAGGKRRGCETLKVTHDPRTYVFVDELGGLATKMLKDEREKFGDDEDASAKVWSILEATLVEKVG